MIDENEIVGNVTDVRPYKSKSSIRLRIKEFFLNLLDLKTTAKRASEKNRKRSSARDWRLTVLERDGYQCTFCGSTENLTVDHIKPLKELICDVILFSNEEDLRENLKLSNIFYDPDNGQTLCERCHKVKNFIYEKKDAACTKAM